MSHNGLRFFTIIFAFFLDSFLGFSILLGQVDLVARRPNQIGNSLQANGSSLGEVADGSLEEQSEFDEVKAFEHLKAICDMGPRISGTRGMLRQREYLKEHFENLEARIVEQKFLAKSPFNGRDTELLNLIVQFFPDRTKRLLVCCHYDTRPFADRDLRNPQGRFIGANDGASGVGLLCELGRHLETLNGAYGIDLIFFDGEEFVIRSRIDPMFLGSTYFANQYAANQIAWRYEYGILVDMIGDKDLQIYFEGNSLGYHNGDRLSRSIWSVANELGVKEFIPTQRHKIRDDHLPLNEIAKIPVCDIIDFDFPNPQKGNIFWHTQNDNPRNCSAESLGKVGRVLLEWLRQMQKLNP